MRRALIAAIRFYQRYLSPLIPANCRYIPTCSEYMLTAIQHHGAGRGLWLGLKRIGRCHPLGSCGYDPVPLSADQESKTQSNCDGNGACSQSQNSETSNNG